ncbi:MAG: hypothetical protein RX316_10615, partial [bacterium]|nr:hypothetical protein [bacterium]
LESVEVYEARKPITKEERDFFREYIEATRDVRERYAGKLSESIAAQWGVLDKESGKGTRRAREEGRDN